MQGTITSKEVILQWVTIVRLWGARCYLRCLRAAVSRTPSTFLGVVTQCGDNHELVSHDSSWPRRSSTRRRRNGTAHVSGIFQKSARVGGVP